MNPAPIAFAPTRTPDPAAWYAAARLEDLQLPLDGRSDAPPLAPAPRCGA